jgi:hypothetical protein
MPIQLNLIPLEAPRRAVLPIMAAVSSWKVIDARIAPP